MGRLTVGLRYTKPSRYTLPALAGALECVDGIDIVTVDGPCPADIDLLAYSFTTLRAKEVYRELATLPRGVRTIAGGPHPSARPAEALKNGFDWVCVGEGEDALGQLSRTLRDGVAPTDIPGIYGRGHDGPFESAPPVDLDAHPSMSERLRLFAPLEISRGCPFGCGYCQVTYLLGRCVRHRSLDSVDWTARLYARNGKQRIWFLAPNSFAYGSDGRTPRPEKLAKLLDTVRSHGVEPYLGTFPSEVRPDFVTPEVMAVVTDRVANHRLSVGAQCGSDRLLREMGRGHTADDVRLALDVAGDHGFTCDVDILFGLPGETAEDVELTLDLLDDVFRRNGRAHVHVFIPLPGTPYESEPAGKLSDATRSRLGLLANEGRVTGAWGWQEGVIPANDTE